MKTSRLLGRHGLKTYSDVANQTPEQLTKTLSDSGPMFASNDPASWPEQARLAMDGKWDDIDRLYGSNGVRRTDNDNASTSASGSAGAVDAAQSKEASAPAAASPATSSTTSTTSMPTAAVSAAGSGTAQTSQSPAAPRAAVGGAVRDDLTRIVGIGPKASQLLRREGINSFSELAVVEQPRLRAILTEGGSRFALLDPQSWPEQAALAAGSQWDDLAELQNKLSSSTNGAGASAPATSRVAAASTEAAPGAKDKLTRVEGVGPKIAELLNDAGIHTFKDLAGAKQDNLKAVLEKGGSRFSLADPETWPEQARLAADARWDELEQLQDSLDGGRRA